MKHSLRLAAALLTLTALSHSALAHEGHGLPGISHWHSTDVIGYLDVLYRNIRTEGINSTDLFRLGWAALQIDPAQVRNYTIPVRVGTVGGASVVFVNQPAATGVFADFADDGILQAH